MENIIKIFEDDDFLAVNKESGMLVIPDRYDLNIPNLRTILEKEYGKIFICHRLDKDTSGVIVFAKNSQAHRELSVKFEKGWVDKQYVAIVCGAPEKDKSSVGLPIGELKKKKGVMVIDRQDGKRATTEYEVLERFTDFAYIKAMPKSGRTHQIRIHMQAIGHALAFDPIYNNQFWVKNHEYAEKCAELSIKRLSLHAWKLAFIHFRTKEMLSIEAPIPEDIEKTLAQLRRMEKLNKKKGVYEVVKVISGKKIVNDIK
ncbi:MAG: RluA family pseudouridine synthase [bacterium]